jgi:hypothetical protein
MSRWFSRVALVGALVLSCTVVPATAGVAAVDHHTVQNALYYLRLSQNQGINVNEGAGAWDSDPAFEFVTSEAVLAIAEAAQVDASWSTTEALPAVRALDNVSGIDPLAFLDVVAGGSLSAGKAAKLILQVAAPLGLDPRAFDPAGNGAPVDLVTIMDAGANADGSYGPAVALNQTLYAALALKVLPGRSITPATLAYVRAAQKSSNGGWSFDADTGTTTDADIDTTALAIQVLVAGGVPAGDPAVLAGLRYLAQSREADGTWIQFDVVSADAASRALLGVDAAGYDTESSCWRDVAAPAQAGQPYVGIEASLLALVQPDGSISGAGAFSPQYATAQALQALLGSWLPVAQAAPGACAVATPAPVPQLPSFTG